MGSPYWCANVVPVNGNVSKICYSDLVVGPGAHKEVLSCCPSIHPSSRKKTTTSRSPSVVQSGKSASNMPPTLELSTAMYRKVRRQLTTRFEVENPDQSDRLT